MEEKPPIIIAADADIKIQSHEDIMDALGACFGAVGMLFTVDDLAPEFFDLRSGLLGELFQKFTNYRKKIAIVLPDFTAYGERFSELAYEHRIHNLIRFFHSKEEALTWLNS